MRDTGTRGKDIKSAEVGCRMRLRMEVRATAHACLDNDVVEPLRGEEHLLDYGQRLEARQAGEESQVEALCD